VEVAGQLLTRARVDGPDRAIAAAPRVSGPPDTLDRLDVVVAWATVAGVGGARDEDLVCGGTAGPRSGRPGRGGVGPFAWVPADLGYGGREARRSSIWRASPSARVARRPPKNGGALDGVRALPAKGKNFSFRGCIRRPMGHPPGPTTCTAAGGAPPLRKKVVSSQRTTKAKARRSHSLPLLMYSAPGGLRQGPGRAAESAAGPRTDEDMGATTCVCCCRRTGDAVTNRWWDWRCGCGRWARRCACARRPTGRGEGSER
jgi:hypothetical protein